MSISEAIITSLKRLPEEYVAGYILSKIQELEKEINNELSQQSFDYEWMDALKNAKDELYLYANSIGLNTMEIQLVIIDLDGDSI